MTANMVWYSMTKGDATLATACSLKKKMETPTINTHPVLLMRLQCCGVGVT